jgi:hypothetical protein
VFVSTSQVAGSQKPVETAENKNLQLKQMKCGTFLRLFELFV